MGCKDHENCCIDYDTQCREEVPTLFCFVLVRPASYELALIQSHANAGVGIFGCKAYTVFSDKSVILRHEVPRPGRDPLPMVVTSVIRGPLESRQGGKYNTALNTEVFTKVWRKVFEDGIFWQNDWTVKV